MTELATRELTTRGARVELNDVGRKFSESHWVVDHFNLKIEPGEFVSLLGPSGCGKSTLLRMIAGLDRSDRGQISIDSFGKDFYRGFVFQEAHLLPWRNVLANVSLPLELTGATKAEARARAQEALKRVGLADALEKFPSQLSGGMKMRASVARALVAQPTLLLLDEPFAALDENTRHKLQEDLRQLWETTKITVVFVTHSVSEAVYLSNRAIVLSKKPARILLDRKTDLPMNRCHGLRTDPVFQSEMRVVYEAYPREDDSL